MDVIAELYFEFYRELRDSQGWEHNSIQEYREEIKSFLESNNIFILAKKKDKYIGFARISEREESYWIEELYIDPTYRGIGCGKKLVKVVESEIKKHDTMAYIMVLPQDRRALAFWLKMGYTLLNTVELAKDLEPSEEAIETRVIEIMGIPLKIFKWKRECYNEVEEEFLNMLEKFYNKGGTQEEYLRIVIDAIKEWLRGRK